MMMPFTQESKAHAIRIMQNISQRPCAKPFLFPVDPIATNCIDYYNVIKKPICISLIINKLLSAEENYPNIESWRSDILLIYQNVITYHGIGSPICALAETFLKIFEKKFRSFSICYDSSLWLKSFSAICQKEKMLEVNMPGTLGSVYRSLFVPPAVKQTKALSVPKMDVFIKNNENTEHTSPRRASKAIEPQNDSNSDIVPKPKAKGRPKKNTLLDPASSNKDKTEKTPKRKPRKPKMQVERKDFPSDLSDNKSNRIFPLKLNASEIDSSLIDDIQQSYSPLEKTIIIPEYHDQIDKTSISTDISPASFITYGISSNVNSINVSNDNSISEQIHQSIKEDHFSNSLFSKSAISIEPKISQPIQSKIIQNDNMISPPEECGRIGLPAKLEEKVEDMEDDVLFEVTSCFT